ncbi:DNA adenine methylase [Sphingopyxis granuli]|nr:DNA adenine methylase [Sphingopyxis granuli]
MMSVGISYMGTKRELATTVSLVIADCQPGPILDVFSGMCSVGEAVAQSRQVWTNDIQVFAYEVAQALFTSQEHPLRSQAIADRYYDDFALAYGKLSSVYGSALEAEDAVMAASNFDEFERERRTLNVALDCCRQVAHPQKFHLFSKQYSDTFIGVRQALEIDAIVTSINSQLESSASFDHARWLTIALGRSMLRVSNTTGHFAQYLQPKIGNFRTFQRQRKRKIWQEFLEGSDEVNPVGNSLWRKNNKTFNSDTLLLLPKLLNEEERPAVIYADPPYTNDQYSRYYHLLDTLVLYDYPTMTGKGLYRPDRFSTNFSLKAKAATAMDSLVQSSAQLGSDIVLSYPSNGLVYSAGIDPLEILKRHYGTVEVCHSIGHDHSTFGASKGSAKSSVVEMIYRGRL